jgi:hypothetical protein
MRLRAVYLKKEGRKGERGFVEFLTELVIERRFLG